MSKTNSDLLTPSEAAEVIGVSRQQVQNYLNDEDEPLPCIEVKGNGKKRVVVRLIKRDDAITRKNDRRSVGRPSKKPYQKTPKKKKT